MHITVTCELQVVLDFPDKSAVDKFLHEHADAGVQASQEEGRR